MVDPALYAPALIQRFALVFALATFTIAPAGAMEIDPQCAPLHNNITCICSLQVGGSVHELRGGGGLRSFYSKRSEAAFNRCLEDARASNKPK